MQPNVTEIDEGIVVVTFEKVTDTDDVSDFRGTINKALAKGQKDIIIDLKKVDQLDELGMAALLRALQVVRKQNGRLVLCNIAEQPKDILTATDLITIFEHRDTRDEAVSSFG